MTGLTTPLTVRVVVVHVSYKRVRVTENMLHARVLQYIHVDKVPRDPTEPNDKELLILVRLSLRDGASRSACSLHARFLVRTTGGHM